MMLGECCGNGEIKGNAGTVLRLIDRIEYKGCMRAKEEEDITQQKVPLYIRCSQLTCVLTSMQLTHVLIPTQLTCILIPTQHICILIQTSLMQASLEPIHLPIVKRSRTRCGPSRQTVATLESNDQT